MNSVAEVFGKRQRSEKNAVSLSWILPSQLTGIEIEVEGIAREDVPELSSSLTWGIHKDGSLRNGTEFVLSRPLAGDELATAIVEMFPMPRQSFEKSATSGTHVHLDMLDSKLSPSYVIPRLYTLIFCLEEAIFAIAGDGREQCGYCNKLQSAPDYLTAAVLSGEKTGNFVNMVSLCDEDAAQIGRYYGFNMMALEKYGSVEFRYFPTASNARELIDWVNLCQAFKAAALSLKTHAELVEVFNDEYLYSQFINRFFSRWRDVFMQATPFFTARQMLFKAEAITEAFNVKTKNELLNVVGLAKGERFKKFFAEDKKPTPSLLPIMYCDSNHGYRGVVDPGQMLAHTVMVYAGTHCAHPSYWSERGSHFSGSDVVRLLNGKDDSIFNDFVFTLKHILTNPNNIVMSNSEVLSLTPAEVKYVKGLYDWLLKNSKGYSKPPLEELKYHLSEPKPSYPVKSAKKAPLRNRMEEASEGEASPAPPTPTQETASETYRRMQRQLNALAQSAPRVAVRPGDSLTNRAREANSWAEEVTRQPVFASSNPGLSQDDL